MKRCAAGLLMLAAASATCAAPRPEPGDPLWEISGLARSLRDPTLLWAHNDSGDRPMLYRTDDTGADLGRLVVPAARARDWEDLAAFRDVSGPALLIADTGDNAARRKRVTLYAVSDPGRGPALTLLWRLHVRYADGPRDCEAVMVDTTRREILLLTKRDVPPRLYRVPLPSASPGVLRVAEFVGTLGTLPATTGAPRAFPWPSQYGQQPTGFAVAPGERRLAVITQRTAYVYEREGGESWLAALARDPLAVLLPHMWQVESGAFDPDGRRLRIASEGRGAQRFATVAVPDF